MVRFVHASVAGPAPLTLRLIVVGTVLFVVFGCLNMIGF